MTQFQSNSIFWIDTEKVHPNPFQPRREFDETRLADLADSIRMYGILQPLVVTRKEKHTEDGLVAEYELISGERRLRASRIAGLSQVPALIRAGEDSDREKLELAIIENLQREDLNSVERARAFQRLVEDFGFKHGQIAKKVGRSREYVSNTIRILAMPEDMLNALSEGKISEGHTRPLLMLIDRPDEQSTLFKEIVYKKMTVREAELIARKIAYEKARRRDLAEDPELLALEDRFKETLGTRVSIERTKVGGKLHIDFFTPNELMRLLDAIETNRSGEGVVNVLEDYAKSLSQDENTSSVSQEEVAIPEGEVDLNHGEISNDPLDDRSKDEKSIEDTEDMYSIKNFSI
ncbi:MAG: hypothetical protein COV70_00145 [Parcubacteria group bacterium CG11_big_fil_rev_8_21_14_0_20_39_22]|nr:MAG: hypothetical protein COV70_00145 [Parcubacteria group bacterium CG11_big_fil_rev_8_21_14_0_20_39_22]